MTSSRWMLLGLCLGLVVVLGVRAEPGATGGKDKKPGTGGGGGGNGNGDVQMVEHVLAARKDYQESLEALRAYYVKAGEIDRARWAEDELLQYHRTSKYAYRLDLEVPPPNLQPLYNMPEANELMRRAIGYKDKGWGTTYIDNQRRAEILLQQMLTKHPQCNKIDEAAYMLGELYESSAFRQYPRAAIYYERCFQWNPKTHHDARLRSARLYERLSERGKAVEIYKEITLHETDPKRIDEANRKLAELKAK
jgi:tetratricopeptide (TPR) repeat protein